MCVDDRKVWSTELKRDEKKTTLQGLIEPIRFFILESEHAQSDGKSVNRGLPLLDLARGRDSRC